MNHLFTLKKFKSFLKAIPPLALLAVLFFSFAFTPIQNTLVLENNWIKVTVNTQKGTFTVLEKKSNQLWKPDPWEGAAGLLTFKEKGKLEDVNLSKSQKITVTPVNKHQVTIVFKNPVFNNGTVAKNVEIVTELRLDKTAAKLAVEVVSVNKGNYNLTELRYPSRAFSLETDVDRGAAVIPQKQGIISPSYIFPMNGGSFCMWDDATYYTKTSGKLPLFNNGNGLTMPWWGTHNEKSAVVGIVDKSALPKMFYNINNNGQYLFNSQGKMSPYKRIQFLDPVWDLNRANENKIITYQFIPGGTHVQMAKAYRKQAIKDGYFVSLKEKAKRDPDVNKLQGAIYMGLYGGYPHYVEMPGMAFTFKELSNIIKTTHDELGVNNAFFHAWGVFSNFVPNCWPINENLGGVKGLKEAVDLTKKYGYLYSSYHAYSATLENDPDFNTDLFDRTKDGKLINTGSRWANIDPNKQLGLAKKSLHKEIAALGLEADITDISFARLSDKPEKNVGLFNLAKYIDSLNLVNGTEHGQQQFIPYFDMFEGLTYLPNHPLGQFSHRAPLFNLVYHDAIAIFGKIQDPDNQISINGDFRVKSLRNMLYGLGTTIFFSPYEFDGMKEMIQMANKVVSPVHKETFFAELIHHEYLSENFNLQKSTFASGTKVIVNMGPVAQKTKKGLVVPAYGWYVTLANGKIHKGNFGLSIQ
ncbi:glycoside hydrolase [Ochrovirga pacifica]|uniref:glycoside hydrolase n=1 Tax=Ochrovirga pacifica TaxID=1042376 RepID=UPI00025597E1|nr:glycoside hydrolase [Ochrovirga pacifica]